MHQPGWSFSKVNRSFINYSVSDSHEPSPPECVSDVLMTPMVEAEAEVRFAWAAFGFSATKSIFKQTEASTRQRVLQIDAQPYRNISLASVGP